MALHMDNWGQLTYFMGLAITPFLTGFWSHLGIQKRTLAEKTHAEETPMQPLRFANLKGRLVGYFRDDENQRFAKYCLIKGLLIIN